MQKNHLEPYESSLLIIVHGIVQGVGFRFFTYKKAIQLDIVGYVKNLDNGDVEIIACGSKTKIAALTTWLEQGGPPSAKIENCRISNIKPKEHYITFNVRY